MLTERLATLVRGRPDDPALILLGDGESETGRLSFGELDRRARAGAARLVAEGLVGRPVLVPAETSLAFLVAVCACLYAGAAATPTPPVQRGRGLERVRWIARASGATAVISGDAAWAAEGLACIDLAADPGAPGADLPALDPARPAILQFTSGSTTHPRGVVISHGALSANLSMVVEAFGADEGSRLLSWLPAFHDMGLIALLAGLHAGFPVLLMPPLKFLQRPARWLRAISRHGATISGAPNFAYALCARRMGAEDLAGLDLSAWRVAFCGAEPIHADALARFAEAAAPAGFDPGALYPCYGLAEATVYVSGGPRGRGVRTRMIDGRAVVSCGPPAPGSAVEIIDPAVLRPAPPGAVGEVWVAGPHVAAAHASHAADGFDARLQRRPERWLRTGDLGALIEGELYVTGRLRDLIIHRGVNHHPEAIEATVFASAAAYEVPGAAFAVEHGGEEQVVVVQELPRGFTGSGEALAQAALEAVARQHGLALHDLRLVRPGALPRTTSGKVRRGAAKALYEAGGFAQALDTGRAPLGRPRQSGGASSADTSQASS